MTRSLSKSCVVVAAFLGTVEAHAAFPTRTLEGVSSKRELPEVHLGVRFDQDFQKATIVREFVTGAGTADASFGERKELEYEEVRRRLVVEGRIGIYEHFDVRANLPIVLQWDSNIGFAPGAESTSSVYGASADDPSFALRYPITTVPQARNRSGIGDVQLGLDFSPVVDGPETAWPTITLGVLVTLPTGEYWIPNDPKARSDVDGTGGVGRGQYVFDLSLGLSRRSRWTVPAFDPYVVFGASLPIAVGRLERLGLEPPWSARIDAGSEMALFENVDKKIYYGLDFGLGFEFTDAGRTWSPLTDYLPDFRQTNVDGDFVTYGDFDNPENYRQDAGSPPCIVDPDTGEATLPGVPCGEFTQVDDHFSFEARFGFTLQPVWWFMFRAGVGVGFVSNHLITGEAAGEDTDPASAAGQLCGTVPCVGRINRVNSRGQDERSPYYDPRYDAPGGRFSATDILNVRFFATATATF